MLKETYTWIFLLCVKSVPKFTRKTYQKADMIKVHVTGLITGIPRHPAIPSGPEVFLMFFFCIFWGSFRHTEPQQVALDV